MMHLGVPLYAHAHVCVCVCLSVTALLNYEVSGVDQIINLNGT